MSDIKEVKKTDKKTVVIRMRVTEKRREEIKKYCKENNMTISELLEYGLSCVMINEDDLL